MIKEKPVLTKSEITIVSLVVVFSSLFSIAINAAAAFGLYVGIQNYLSAHFWEKNKYSSYDDFNNFVNSKYNISKERYLLINTSKEITGGVRYYCAVGLDRCRQHGVNCTLFDTATHFLRCSTEDVKSYLFETYTFSISYNEEKRLDYFKYCLVFMPKIQTLDSPDIKWITKKDLKWKFPSGVADNNSEYYSLEIGNNVIARLIFSEYYLPADSRFDSDLYSCIIKEIERIKTQLLQLYRTEYML